ncbi:sodium:solute symporter, partial [Planctomycetota bacterium]
MQSESVWTVITVTAYLAVLTVVALKARAARRFEDFSLAGRSLPLPLVFGSLAATYVGALFSIGFVGLGFHSGYLFLGLGIAVAVQNVLVGLMIAPRLRALEGCHTLGDIIGQKYNRLSQIIAGLISVGLCTALAGVMIKAGGQLIADAVGLPLWSGVIIFGGVTTLYTTFGGLRASVVTDGFQFLAFTILVPVLFILLISTGNSTGEGFTAKAISLTISGGHNMSWIDMLGWLTAFLLGETLIPPYANRALASRSTRIARNSFILAGVFSIVWFVVVTSLGILAATDIGIVEHIAGLPSDIQEDAVLTTLVQYRLPKPFYGLLLVVLMSVIMSSLDSLLNAGAVSCSRDIACQVKTLSSDRALTVGRSATVLIAMGAAVGALMVPGILAGLRVCYTIWAPAILPALILGLYLRRASPLAGILSMITGTLTAVLFE